MKKTIKDLDLNGRRAFVRVDFNVPIKNGRITDETRITASLPTIQYALEHGATVILASHLGRPKGKRQPEMSLRPVAERLGELLERPVVFTEDCVGDEARAGVARAGKGGVVLLENLRFHPEEEKNDSAFARELASLADTYVNDAFGAAHRAHASTEGIVHHVKQAAAGLLMEAELEHLGRVLESPVRPFVAVLGGAKVSDKIEVIENLLPRLDALVIGGAMAYTFFLSRGVPTGKSLVEPDRVDSARDVEAQASTRRLTFELPVDHVVTTKIEAGAPSETIEIGDPRIGDRIGVDIGPKTTARYGDVIRDAKTVVWNGPMGVFEIDAFAKGTLGVANAVAAVEGTTIIGGGDSIAAVKKAGVADRMTHISTGGGASLEFLGGRTLPGVAVLP
ncbi:MAG TPA: phosphoglycerate kinase, partial [Vicinamibacterales bacterium]|nr:phosphoglycerate kinase [Vicinamibacterales bacterium]